MLKSVKLLFAILPLAAFAQPACADWPDAAWAAPSTGFLQLADISADTAAARASGKTRGRVLSTRRKARKGHDVYVVRILTPGGRVKRIVIDAKSGKVKHH